MMKNTFFTIGHSIHAEERFIALLKQHSIQMVCDVRSQPYSKYNKQFNKEYIEKALEKHKIAYLFLGKELGGRSENSSYYINGKLQYNLLSKDSLFQRGLNRLIAEKKKHIVAVMCSESDPLKCHRTILICHELCRTINFPKDRIYHILSDGSLQSHKEIEKTLLEQFKISPDMLRDEKECIKEAYHRQAQKIAYSWKKDKEKTTVFKKDKTEDSSFISESLSR